MSVTLFGTCRINGVMDNNNINNLVSYTHSTKEVIQLIKFLTGAITIPPPFDKLCFRSGICSNNGIKYDIQLHKLFEASKTCVIEICSEKTYVYDNYFLHHLSVDNRFRENNVNTPTIIKENYKCIKLSKDEIENDILEIQQLIAPRKMILVTHYNSQMNGVYIPSRNKLITNLTEIAAKHNIPLVNPTEVLASYPQEKVMSYDLGHYTQLGLDIMSDYLNNFINLHNLPKI